MCVGSTPECGDVCCFIILLQNLNENILQRVAVLVDPLNAEHGFVTEPCESV